MKFKQTEVTVGELYNCVKRSRRQSKADRFTGQTDLLKLEYKNNKYEIFFTRKRANRYSVIHCKDNAIIWEQFPEILAGRVGGKQEPIISIGPKNDCIRIFVIRGKPRNITGLDEGVFRSIHKFDESFINVMSERKFKEL